jgi:6,7-dimethyl-8-ribityllumazine synthase
MTKSEPGRVQAAAGGIRVSTFLRRSTFLIRHSSAMSQFVPPKPGPNDVRREFVLVASQFNESYVEGLVTHCTEELRNLAPVSKITLHQVPGAFEIPIVVRAVALKDNVDAIVALGVILQGETAHAQHLGQSVTHALQQISLEHGVPVIHAVLSLQNEEQARKRCLGDDGNRGTEAARAAFAMSGLLAELRK